MNPLPDTFLADPSLTFVALLDALLARAAIDTDELAVRLGVDHSLPRHWRRADVHRRPDPRTTLPRLARILGCNATEARVLYRLCGVDVEPVLGDEPAQVAS